MSDQSSLLIPRLSFSAIIGKAESHIARSDLSAVKAEITPERLRRALLFTPADAILVSRRSSVDGSPSVSRIQLAMNCQKAPDDSGALLLPYMVQSDASPDARRCFMEILDSLEPLLSRQIANGLTRWYESLGTIA
jgi:hypothetical protein